MMPQLLALIAAGVGLWVGYRLVRHEMSRVADDLRKAEDALARRGEKQPRRTLVRDPETGVYRPDGGAPPSA